jgi:hypothetical protein
MSFLDKVVQQTITTATRTPTQAGFGTAMIAGFHTNFAPLIKQYSNADDMLVDGFTTADQLYKDALHLKSQNPAPSIFKIGRLTTAVAQSVRLIPVNTTEGYVYEGTINGEEFEYEVANGDDVELVIDGLDTDIGAFTDITTTDNTSSLDVDLDNAGELFEFDVPSTIHLIDNTPATNLATELAAIATDDDDWYCLLLDSNSEARVAAAAAWLEARRKIFVAQTSDWDAKDAGESGDVASGLQSNSYARTGIIWHHQIGSSASAAWAGVMLPTTPGSATWAFKTLAGVPVTTMLDAEADALEAKNANYYRLLAGIGSTFEGTTGAGEYFDVTRLVDWIYARTQEAIAGLLLNSPKIPFTNAGIDRPVGLIRGVLSQAIANGGLTDDPAPVVTAPLASEVSAVNKGARTLPDIRYQAVLAGAIHKLQITGVISV